MMKKKLLTFLLVLAVSFAAMAQSGDLSAIRQLVDRLIPEYAEKFEFKEIDSDDDVYTLESKDGVIQISGNNANSMAVGLNTYLKRYCNTTVSWYAEVPVVMPAVLPEVAAPETATAKVDRRFFLNYCTYGYTMPFWGWKEWERLIDWMALNGVNMPLAITGQEAVWYNVWTKLGMSDEEVRNYFTGPTYLPWHRMANIDGWNGPLPKEWLDNQIELQSQILKRERELNMRPVLPAFAGHVPVMLKKLFPDANIQSLGTWAGFSKEYSCHFLNPEEPLFAKIQKLFLEEQTRLFGTDHIYGVDPFNEVDPPSWEPKYLKEISKNMYKTLTAVDRKAEWMQMGWMFYHDSEHWTAPRIKALLTGAGKNKMSILDYHCEKIELWKQTDKFHGQPYIWCYLGNFGGNTTLTGNVKESGARLDKALVDGGKNLLGIGSTLEGLDVVQFPYEYIFEKAWSNSMKDEDWVKNLADRHLGEAHEDVRSAWNILFNDIFVQVPRTLGTLVQLSPLDKRHPNRITNDYTNKELFDAWSLLLKTPNVNRNEMQIDLVTVGRQLLGNLFAEARAAFDEAYKNKNLTELYRNAELMRQLMNDMDDLCSYHYRTSVCSWIDDARNYGSNKTIQDYYEKNARNLITTWGGRLNDYASRGWAGLISDYYSKRWGLYIDNHIIAAENGDEVDEENLAKAMKLIEDSWVNSLEPVKVKKGYDLLTCSKLMLERYKGLIK